MHQLAIEAVGETALLQGHDCHAVASRKRSNRHVRHTLAVAGRGQIDVSFSDRPAPLARLGHDLH